MCTNGYISRAFTLHRLVISVFLWRWPPLDLPPPSQIGLTHFPLKKILYSNFLWIECHFFFIWDTKAIDFFRGQTSPVFLDNLSFSLYGSLQALSRGLCQNLYNTFDGVQRSTTKNVFKMGLYQNYQLIHSEMFHLRIP